MADSDKPKRRWYQFSLRTLLLFVLLASVGLSWFTVKMNQVRKQREAVKAIVEAGGCIAYHYEVHENGRWEFATEPSAPVWLRKLFGDDFFGEIAGVAAVDSDFGDAELEHVKGLVNLKELHLDGTQVTDAGLEHVTGLTRLEVLVLSATKVTDAGLKHLRGLAGLSHLFLYGTQVTDKGVNKLQQALPDCSIVY